MKRKGILYIAGCVIFSLVLVACSSSSTTAPQASSSAPTSAAAPSTAASTLTTAAGQPQYGGVFDYWLQTDPLGFDEGYAVHPNIVTAAFTNDTLMVGDWSKGAAGTGQTDWVFGYIGHVNLMTGSLAQSWEFPDDTTIVYHLRQGVHWALNPNSDASRLVNGREVTADDVVYSINRAFTMPMAYLNGAYTSVGNNPTSITALDKYTVQVKTPPTMHGLMLMVCGDFLWIWPKEVIAKYGDMKDWRNSEGTGPFMLTDYVPGSSITLAKNSNYFAKDPLHTQNQLPYLNGVNMVIIADVSTRQAALRTGKIDMLPGLSYDDAQTFMKTNPDLAYLKVYASPTFPVGRMDKNLPFNDIRVRQALNLAVDKQAIMNGYYAGHAALLGYPFPPTAAYSDYYTPLDQQDSAVQALFTYNPDKAKQLLADAGYPNGFTTHIVCDASSDQPDLLSIIKADLAKVNVDLEIQPLESGVYVTQTRGRTFSEMLMKGSVDYIAPYRMLMVRKESFDDPAFIDDPYVRTRYNEVSKLLGIDDATVNKDIKEVGQWSLEQAWGIWTPAPETYIFWQPWLGDYHGEQDVGYLAGPADRVMDWIWIDQSKKASMSH